MACLGRLKRRLDQIKIIAPIKFLLEVFAQGDSYRVIISLVNGQIILIVVYIHCIQHQDLDTQQRGSIKQIYPSHFDTKWELRKINSAISIAVLYFCTLMCWNNCP